MTNCSIIYCDECIMKITVTKFVDYFQHVETFSRIVEGAPAIVRLRLQND